jgi:hypothetical protein
MIVIVESEVGILLLYSARKETESKLLETSKTEGRRLPASPLLWCLAGLEDVHEKMMILMSLWMGEDDFIIHACSVVCKVAHTGEVWGASAVVWDQVSPTQFCGTEKLDVTHTPNFVAVSLL